MSHLCKSFPKHFEYINSKKIYLYDLDSFGVFLGFLIIIISRIFHEFSTRVSLKAAFIKSVILTMTFPVSCFIIVPVIKSYPCACLAFMFVLIASRLLKELPIWHFYRLLSSHYDIFNFQFCNWLWACLWLCSQEMWCVW